MPRKKKTETTDSEKTPKKEVRKKTTRYGAIALQENAKLKKPTIRGSLK